MSVSEDSVSLQKGLSEWWSEETDYVFQRIERWAAFARGYNRLRSQRLSRGRLTMHEEQEPRWSISSNKIVIEDPNWSPHFHNLKRSHRRKSKTDENSKINCCGTFDYQSRNKLDSSCLENYGYDHSIYFKTIGDIKSSKRDLKNESQNDFDEQIEWENKIEPPFNDFCNDDLETKPQFNNFCTNDLDIETKVDNDIDDRSKNFNIWPIVDLNKLTINNTCDDDFDINNDIQYDDNNNNNNSGNNNYFQESQDSTEKMIELQIDELTNKRIVEKSFDSSSSRINNQEGMKSMKNSRKPKRSPRRVKQPNQDCDNNVTWPGVLINYTKNIDPANSPHHHYLNRQIHVK